MKYSNFQYLDYPKTWNGRVTAIVDERIWYAPWKTRQVTVYRYKHSQFWRRLDDGNFVDYDAPDQVRKLEEQYTKEQELIDKIAGLK